MRWLDNITDSMDMNLSKLQETVKDKEAWCCHPQGREGTKQQQRLPSRTPMMVTGLSPSSCLTSLPRPPFQHIPSGTQAISLILQGCLVFPFNSLVFKVGPHSFVQILPHAYSED